MVIFFVMVADTNGIGYFLERRKRYGISRKHGFKLAVLALCSAMGIYLFISIFKGGPPQAGALKAAPTFRVGRLGR